MWQCWRGRGICPLFSSPTLRIWQLKSPHSRVFAIQGKTKKMLMPGGSARGGGGRGASRSWNWLILIMSGRIEYCRKNLVANCFGNFGKKKNKTNCQKCIANSTRIANCSKTLLLMFVAILAKIHLIEIAGKNSLHQKNTQITYRKNSKNNNVYSKQIRLTCTLKKVLKTLKRKLENFAKIEKLTRIIY